MYTVLYSDLFEYPLTRDELHHRLIGMQAERTALDATCTKLIGPYLEEQDGYLCLKGRMANIETRRHRQTLSDETWPVAYRYAKWLRRVPFMRMVAVSGSLAVNNTNDEGDVDLFCITAPNRMWIARLFMIPMARATRLFKKNRRFVLCPNYILTEHTLDVPTRNLFAAHEVAQAVPVWGATVYHAFLEANPWILSFLPASTPNPVAGGGDPAYPHPRLTRFVEWVLRGRLGSVLDAGLYRTLTFLYKARAKQRGWIWTPIATAYQKERYTIPEGGYIHIVRQLFADRVETHLGTAPDAKLLQHLFGPSETENGERVYGWSEDFVEQYR